MDGRKKQRGRERGGRVEVGERDAIGADGGPVASAHRGGRAPTMDGTDSPAQLRGTARIRDAEASKQSKAKQSEEKAGAHLPTTSCSTGGRPKPGAGSSS